MKLIIKYFKIDLRRINTIQARLQWIKKTQPSQTFQIQSYGFNSNNILQLVYRKLPGESLFDLQGQLPKHTRQHIAQILRQQCQQWTNEAFVHGDLSPRNIIVQLKPLRLYFIDWLLDLTSYAGTPKYCSPTLFKMGHHNHLSDQFAMQKIIEELLRN